MNMFKSKHSKKVPVKSKSSSSTIEKSGDKKPKLDEFISNRDYTGAITLLEFQRHTEEANPLLLPWLGYAAFHLGDYKKALDVYIELAKNEPVYYLYASCCQFYLGEYKEAEEFARKLPGANVNIPPTTANGRLQNRLLFHISHKQNNEEKLMKHHALITDATEDQLSLASIHYLRNHFQEATDIYKRLLIEYRDYLALQVYVVSTLHPLHIHPSILGN
jgi:intraflagellar transport protein 56